MDEMDQQLAIELRRLSRDGSRLTLLGETDEGDRTFEGGRRVR